MPKYRSSATLVRGSEDSRRCKGNFERVLVLGILGCLPPAMRDLRVAVGIRESLTGSGEDFESATPTLGNVLRTNTRLFLFLRHRPPAPEDQGIRLPANWVFLSYA